MGQPAARLLDEVAHTSAMGGFLTGALVGLAVGVAIVATVATGGAALAVVAAVGAGVATTGAGALLGESLGGTFTSATGTVIQVGSPNVFVNGRPAVRAQLDAAQCSNHSGAPSPVAQGSGSVHYNGQPAARKGDKCACGAVISAGSANVMIGGPTATVMEISSEVPGWMHTTASLMVAVGSAVASGTAFAASQSEALGVLAPGRAGCVGSCPQAVRGPTRRAPPSAKAATDDRRRPAAGRGSTNMNAGRRGGQDRRCRQSPGRHTRPQAAARARGRRASRCAGA